jgi:hypothetical protein
LRVSFGGVPERSKGADCKSAGHAFEGSNPSPSTKGVEATNLEARPAGLGCDRRPVDRCRSDRFGRRGCSSMVEQKPSKLTTRVRFPSPAPVSLETRGGAGGVRGTRTAATGAAGARPGDRIQCKRPCSSVAEHSLGKGEVERSIRSMGTRNHDAASLQPRGRAGVDGQPVVTRGR